MDIPNKNAEILYQYFIIKIMNYCITVLHKLEKSIFNNSLNQ